MKLAIINCDLDENKETNTSNLLNLIVPDTMIIDYTKGDEVSDFHEFDGFIVTGSRAHINDEYFWIKNIYKAVKKIRLLDKPYLGICFGMDVITDSFGGKVAIKDMHELGFTEIDLEETRLFNGIPTPLMVYESHYDATRAIPEGAKIIAKNKNCIQSYIYGNFYCIQFHPEISPKVAKLMAERDGDDLDKIFNGVDLNYEEPIRVLINFYNIVGGDNIWILVNALST